MGDWLKVPVTYQGGKSRIAGQIVDAWWPTAMSFVDLCCGSGAVSIEMVNRGYPADEITMVDAGPWGLFWSEIGAGVFDLDTFKSYVDAVPSDPRLVQGFLQDLSNQSALNDTAEVFILLQAGSFGGKALWIENGRWCNNTFRSYWEPTATSRRRSHVNPMMPMPDTLLRRVEAVVDRMDGVSGWCAAVEDIDVGEGNLVYIDPPYMGTTTYGHTLDVEALFDKLTPHNRVYVSEGRTIGTEGVRLSAGRSKGGISGNRKVKANEEWLSVGGWLDVSRTREWPTPTTDEPTVEQIGDWIMDVEWCEATDGMTDPTPQAPSEAEAESALASHERPPFDGSCGCLTEEHLEARAALTDPGTPT